MPAYNEEGVIADVIKGLVKVFDKQSFNYKIIVVDDGSKDSTPALARSAGAHVIEHILNTGSGGATATGLRYAHRHGFDIAATLDADGQHDPKDVLKGVKLMIKGGSALLVGSRLIDTAGMSFVKILGNKGLSLMTYVLFGINITDSQSGLRVFSKESLSTLRWQSSGYEFCSEMLWRAKQLGLQIEEFPIKAIYTDYSKSKGQNNWNGFNILKILLQRRLVEFFGE
jgi:glycosyltransferase involved in cell wall biosynthesis